MRVQWATLARYAEVEVGHALMTIVGAGTDVRMPSLPSRLTTYLALQLRCHEPMHPASWEALFSFGGAISFTVDAVGTYSIGIDLTGAHAAEIRIRMVELL